MDEGSFSLAASWMFRWSVFGGIVAASAIAGPVAAYLMPWALMPDAPEAVRVAVGSLLCVCALYVVAFLVCLLRAPYAQRNEARSQRDRLQNQVALASDSDLGALGISARQASAAESIQRKNQRP